MHLFLQLTITLVPKPIYTGSLFVGLRGLGLNPGDMVSRGAGAISPTAIPSSSASTLNNTAVLSDTHGATGGGTETGVCRKYTLAAKTPNPEGA